MAPLFETLRHSKDLYSMSKRLMKLIAGSMIVLALLNILSVVADLVSIEAQGAHLADMLNTVEFAMLVLSAIGLAIATFTFRMLKQRG